MNGSSLIHAKGLRKQFGAIVAARDITVDIHAQTVTGLIGTNGAGKTTFVNMLTGYLKPDEGTIHFSGADITGRPPTRDHTTRHRTLLPDSSAFHIIERARKHRDRAWHCQAAAGPGR